MERTPLEEGAQRTSSSEKKTALDVGETADRQPHNDDGATAEAAPKAALLEKPIASEEHKVSLASDSDLLGPESGSDDDDDDEPPRLKYSRLSNLPATFFARDPVSTCTVHDSVMMFATHSGIIHICNSTDMESIRTFKAHKASVLALYTDGSFFASASMDGTVVVGSITDSKDVIVYDFKRPVHAVVLDRNFKHSRSFVTGGMSGKLVRSSKNWLGQRVDVTLDEGNGSPIVGIFQLQDLFLWMNDAGISVYHVPTKTKISTIDRPPNSPRGDMYWPRCYFPEVDRIVIAWADHIWLLRVEGEVLSDSFPGAGATGGVSGSNSSKILIPSAATISFRAATQKLIVIDHVLKLDDCLIAGISTFKDDLCIIFAYNPPTTSASSGRIEFHNPEVKLINTSTGEIVFEEEIGLKDVSNLGLNDYTLGTYIGEKSLPRYFLVSAKDAVIAQEVTLMDRLNWFIDNERFYEAWNISEHLVSPLKRLNLGTSHVDGLIQQEKWSEVAAFLKVLLYLDSAELADVDTKSTIQPLVVALEVLQRTQQQHEREEHIKEIVRQWDNWSGILIDSGHIEILTDIIPTLPALGLSRNTYTKILRYWLSQRIATFYHLLDTWDPELYDIKVIENLIEEKLEDEYGNDHLRRYLVQLYVKSHEPRKSVSHLVVLKDGNIIDFLEQYHLLSTFIDHIPEYVKLRFDEETKELTTAPLDTLKVKVEDVVDLLVANRHELPSRTIVDLMFKHHLDFFNNLYLEKLNSIDEYLTRGFSNERMVLFSQFDRGKLLGFLMREGSGEYDIDKAIELCKANLFTEELVYLLGKIGETRKALMLIINELDDPAKAIKFAKHQNEEEAWTILLDYSMSKPAFIKALIELADDQSSLFYDPVLIIKRIPRDVQIDGLSASVTKISFNNELDLLLNQLILKSIYRESEFVSRGFRQDKLCGIEIDTGDPEIEEIIQKFETIVVYRDKSTRSIKLKTDADFFGDGDVHDSRTASSRKFTTFSEKINHLQAATQA